MLIIKSKHNQFADSIFAAWTESVEWACSHLLIQIIDSKIIIFQIIHETIINAVSCMICAAIDIIHPQTMRGLVGKDNRHCCGVLRIDTGQPQNL